MKHPIRTLFDGISGRYDTMNHLLTAGRDRAWRRTACALSKEDPGSRVLDLCGGTGDLSLAWKDRFPSACPLVADFSLPMLQEVSGKDPNLHAVQMDALRMPIVDSHFDAALCGYGMRNLDKLDIGINEVARILRPGGLFLTLEFFRPTNLWTRFFYGVLGPMVVPLAGAVFAGDRKAYRYLVDSIWRFRSVEEYAEACRNSGFSVLAICPLDGGVSHAVLCRKDS